MHSIHIIMYKISDSATQADKNDDTDSNYTAHCINKQLNYHPRKNHTYRANSIQNQRHAYRIRSKNQFNH